MYIVKYGRTVMTNTGSFAVDKTRAFRFLTVEHVAYFMAAFNLINVFAENDDIVIVEVD